LKDEQNPQGGRPSDGVNVVMGMGRPLLPWTWPAAVSSLRALHGIEQYEDSQVPQPIEKKHGFQCEKAFKWWHWPDAKSRGRKEAIPAEWAADILDLGSQRPVFSGKHLNADVYQELLRQHVFLVVQRMYPGVKDFFQQI
jgi:hypothetical protein